MLRCTEVKNYVVALYRKLLKSIITLPTGAVAKYCDEHDCVCLCVFAVASQPMDKGGQSPRAPKVLGAPEQCSKKFNMDVSRNSRYVSLN